MYGFMGCRMYLGQKIAIIRCIKSFMHSIAIILVSQQYLSIALTLVPYACMQIAIVHF